MLPRPCKHACFLLLMLLLSACGGGFSAGTESPVPSSLPANTLPATITTTPLPVARTALPTNTPSGFTPPPSSAPRTATAAATPLPAILPNFPLNGYVVLFKKDSHLYFQDGEDSPIKLTQIEKESYGYLISDDNEIVVLFREGGIDKIYATNIDGDKNVILIDWSVPYKSGEKIGQLSFLPYTHQLFMETFLCASQEFKTLCFSNISIVDIDNRGINKIASLGLSYQQNSNNKNVRISPNGEMIAVGTQDGVKIYSTGGIIRENILPYRPSTLTVPFPYLSWFPDSRSLVIANPDTVYESQAYDNFPGYTLWKYIIDTDTSLKLPLVSPMPGNGWGYFEISPDGQWGIYGGISGSSPDDSLFITNLITGDTKNIGKDVQPTFSWSPDSRHFIYTSTSSKLGAIHQPTAVQSVCRLHHWIDAYHFTCLNSETNKSPRIAKITSYGIQVYEFGLDGYLVLIKPK